MPSMANRTVVKNSGIFVIGAIHGTDPMSGSGINSLPDSGLTPITTHIIVHPKPTSINVVAMAVNGTISRSERIQPSGRSGNARPKIQARSENCHSGDVCASAT